LGREGGEGMCCILFEYVKGAELTVLIMCIYSMGGENELYGTGSGWGLGVDV